ncbi:protein ACCELERATED CELL DEATH 6-like [Hevea brasiliensis]|uniref:protein ACCELERATED CELL DEATH 6-like n=1 Tax=Hevea brasiliensis TaxID=3981 RepID=UPI0025FAF05A|nr:protein ACCELERATED CELL DEATH 6-like [Hevea brasiliensis]
MADSQALPETQLAAEINDQPKQKVIITFMDAEWYNAAAEDQIDKFKDYTEPLDLLRTPKKNTVLHVYITAVKKETEESIEFVKLVISKCPPLLDEPNIRGETPLHIVARFGYNNIVEFLIRNIKKAQYDDLERGAEESTSDKMLKKTSPNGGTDLHEAERNNHPRVLETLIRENPEFANIANAARESPLYVAAGSTAKRLKKAGYKRGRHSIRQAPPHNMSMINRELMSSLQKASESHQIVATLIATVTFAAGFTLPGGYSGQDGPDEGTAILTRKSAFKTFLVTDTIALALSISVVLIHLIWAALCE